MRCRRALLAAMTLLKNVARPEAQSVVIHAITEGCTPAGGPKIACANLR
jgi:hypothetical protein